mmetsp:Transcript_22837/g.49411  ORF Transcript_22837/g.49411 Transcript_22837/m.49411 type:complete len:88 (-) Transcript_22837:1399-1662(-)
MLGYVIVLSHMGGAARRTLSHGHERPPGGIQQQRVIVPGSVVKSIETISTCSKNNDGESQTFSVNIIALPMKRTNQCEQYNPMQWTV